MTPRSISRRPGTAFQARPSRARRWVALAVAIGVMVFIIINEHGLVRLYQLNQENERLGREINELLDRANLLRTEEASLENDMEYIERLAREKYRLVKQGEKVFRVMPELKEPPLESAAPGP